MTKNYFEVLNAVDVSKKIEKKNGLSYLSWAYAWGELKKLHPDATYTVHENKDGFFYHTDGISCWVKTGVTVNGLEYIEYLPVMDFRNKSIKAAEITSFDVNKAVQRSLTKAIARHGLGLYIYAGEDLPEETNDTRAAAALGGSMMDNTDRSQHEAFHSSALRLLDQCAELAALEAVWKKNYKAWSKLPQDLFEDIEQKKNEVKQEMESKL